MSDRWAIKMRADAWARLTALRLWPELRVCADEHALWLTGDRRDAALDRLLQMLPAVARYRIVGANDLCREAATVPEASLPEGPWQLIRDAVAVEAPRAALAGRQPAPVCPHLVRSDSAVAAGALLLPFDRFAGWACDAPQVRLDPMRFAVSADGRAFVAGVPLPPLAGTVYCLEDGIATPAGMAWLPAIAPAVLARALRLPHDHVALFHADGRQERIARENLLPASRAAVRRTAGV